MNVLLKNNIFLSSKSQMQFPSALIFSRELWLWREMSFEAHCYKYHAML